MSVLFAGIMLSKCYVTTSFSWGMNWELLLLFKLLSCSGDLQLKRKGYHFDVLWLVF